MTQIRAAYWLSVQRRAASLQPDVRRAFFKAFDLIAAGMSDRDIARFIESGGLESFVRELVPESRVAEQPMTAALQRAVERSAAASARLDMGKNGTLLKTPFNVLSPHTVEAIRILDTAITQRMLKNVRETVRETVAAGLEDGKGTAAIARNMREQLALPPSMARTVRNFEKMLRAGDTDALSRKLRDRRFDSALKKMSEKKLTEDQIERMSSAYARRMKAHYADTLSRTATLSAVKLGQRLSWEEAATKGIVDRSRLKKQWVGVKDDRERPEHLKMEGEVVPFDQPFSNGQMIPGEDDYNCRCSAYYFEEIE